MLQLSDADIEVPHSGAEICLNLWYFFDASGIVLRTAGKAYALDGTDDEKQSALQRMAGTDHLTATQGTVPKHYCVSSALGSVAGAIPKVIILDHHAVVFSPLMDKLEEELPKQRHIVDGKYQELSLKIPENPISVTTAVHEMENGELVAYVSKRTTGNPL